MSTPPQNKRPPRQDRIALRPETLERTEQLLIQLRASIRGVKVNRGDIVNWLVASHPPKFSRRELKILKDAFFDEVQLASWALKELKMARVRGEELNLATLLNHSIQSQRPSKKKPKENSASQ